MAAPKKDFKFAILKNVIVDWTFATKPNQFDDYSVDVRVTPEVEKQLNALGISERIKEAKEDDTLGRDKYIQFKLSQIGHYSKAEQKPDVVDADNRPFNQLIGNGSKANIRFMYYPSEKAHDGIAVQFKGIQIVDLVEYGGETAAFGVVEGGFTAEEPSGFEEQAPELASTGTDGDPI